MANRGTRERATYLGGLVGPHPTMRTLRSKFVLGQQFFSPAYVIFSSLKPPTPTSSEPIDRCFNPRVLPNEAHDFLIFFSKRQRQTSCLRRISSRGTACTISSRTIGRAKTSGSSNGNICREPNCVEVRYAASNTPPTCPDPGTRLPPSRTSCPPRLGMSRSARTCRLRTTGAPLFQTCRHRCVRSKSKG